MEEWQITLRTVLIWCQCAIHGSIAGNLAKTSGSLYQYARNKPDGDIAHSPSFKFIDKSHERTSADGTLSMQIVVALKCLCNFWKEKLKCLVSTLKAILYWVGQKTLWSSLRVVHQHSRWHIQIIYIDIHYIHHWDTSTSSQVPSCDGFVLEDYLHPKFQWPQKSLNNEPLA